MSNLDIDILACKQHTIQWQTGWVISGGATERKTSHAAPHLRVAVLTCWKQFEIVQWTHTIPGHLNFRRSLLWGYLYGILNVLLWNCCSKKLTPCFLCLIPFNYFFKILLYSQLVFRTRRINNCLKEQSYMGSEKIFISIPFDEITKSDGTRSLSEPMLTSHR